jgi:hypothetical protein
MAAMESSPWKYLGTTMSGCLIGFESLQKICLGGAIRVKSAIPDRIGRGIEVCQLVKITRK